MTKGLIRLGLGRNVALGVEFLLILRASVVAIVSGMIIVCCTPRIVEVRARTMLAYRKAGLDQCTLEI